MEEPPQLHGHLLSPAKWLLFRQPCLFAEALQEPGKWLRGRPDARLRRIDIGEKAKNSVTIGGPAGKGVHVNQVIACLLTQLAGRLLFRPKADAVQVPAAGVAWQLA